MYWKPILRGLLMIVLLGCLVQPNPGECRQPEGEPPNPEEHSPAGPEKGRNSRVQLALNTGGHTAPIRRADFTQDGSRLVTVGEDRTVQVWDLNRGERRKVLWLPAGNGERGMPHSAELAPDGGQLAYVTHNGDEKGEPIRLVYLLDLETEQLHILARPETEVFLVLSPDGNLLAVTGKGGIQLWDPRQRRQVGKAGYPANAQFAQPAFSPDSKRLAVALGKGTIDVWRLSGKDEVSSEKDCEIAEKPRRRTAWGNDETLLTLSGQALHVWAAAGENKGKELRSVPVPPLDGRISKDWRGGLFGPIHPVPKTKHVLVSWNYGLGGGVHRVGSLLVDWEKGNGRLVGPVLHSTGTIRFGTAVSPDGQRAVFHGGIDFGAYVANLEDGKVVQRLIGKARSLERFGFGWSQDGKAVCWQSPRETEDSRKVRPVDRSVDLVQLASSDVTLKGSQRNRFTTLGELSVKRLDATTLALEGRPGLEKIRIVSSSGGSFCLLANDCLTVQGTHYYDTRTGDRMFVLPDHRIYDGFYASPGGRHVLLRTIRQTLQVVNPRAPQGQWVLLNVFIAGDDWIVWAPEGYYAASPEGEKLIGWVADNGLDRLSRFHPAQRFRTELYRPEVIKLVLEKGSVEEALKTAKVQKKEVEKLLPPQATLKHKQDGARLTVEAVVPANPRTQPVSELHLLVDGRPARLENGEVAVKVVALGQAKAVKESWTITLEPGSHKLSVRALAKDAYSISDEVSLVEVKPPQTAPRTTRQGTLYYLGIGVNQFKHEPGLKLSGAVPDVQNMEQCLRKHCTDRFVEIKPTVLTDEKATLQAILKMLTELPGKLKPADVVIVHYSSHGEVEEGGGLFLLCHDTRRNDMKSTAVPGEKLREVLGQYPCPVLLLLDACHSSKFPLMRPATDPLSRLLADDSCGVAVMTAALAHQKAIDTEKGGIFTQALVEGLQGKADPDKVSKRLFVHHLFSYVYDTVTRETSNKQMPVYLPSGSVPPIVLKE